jgi:ABC-type branched-subunit amino acid transport system substrate-binding protein
MQIFIKAFADAAAKGDVTREAVRAGVTNSGTSFDTVLGPITFDAVGDTSQKIISLYKTDMTAGDGKGDWIFDKQIDYATN